VQEVVGKAQPMTMVVHQVEGQERKYSDNDANGTHIVSMRSELFIDLKPCLTSFTQLSTKTARLEIYRKLRIRTKGVFKTKSERYGREQELVLELRDWSYRAASE
jgi:hypothetical protein